MAFESHPFYRNLIERHHEPILAGEVAAAMKLREEVHELAVKVNGGGGNLRGAGLSPAYVLERATAAPAGTVPMWGADRGIHHQHRQHANPH